MQDNTEDKNILPEHHKQQELCTTRPSYRQGRKLTAVKVYTINNESQHLLFYGVPDLKLTEELKSLCLKYGELKNFQSIDKSNLEEFTKCFHAQFKRIQSARIAKRFLDNKSFYGGVLHVCYAPEYETLDETRTKLKQRHKDVLSRIQPGPSQLEYANSETVSSHQDRKRKHPAMPITDKRLKYENSDAIWNDIPKELDPRLPDSFENYSSVGLKKHFQMPSSESVKPMYGPVKPEQNRLELSESDIKKTPKVILPSVIMQSKKDYNKKIIFRNKIKNSE